MHPRLSWDPLIMAGRPSWAGQLDQLNAALTGRILCVWGGLQIHYSRLFDGTSSVEKHTLTCKFIHFIISLAGLRSHMSLWRLSCTVIRPPHPYSGSLLGGSSGLFSTRQSKREVFLVSSVRGGCGSAPSVCRRDYPTAV